MFANAWFYAVLCGLFRILDAYVASISAWTRMDMGQYPGVE